MADVRFPVEAGHIMMFARAIGDDNPAYYDGTPEAAEHGGLVAPPTFVSAAAQVDPDNPLRPRPGVPWMGSGRTEGQAPQCDAGGTSLHAEQHFRYHRPPRAGDVLTATRRPGGEWEKEGGRGGKLLFSETITEYRDQTGELVVTARTVGVRTQRVVTEEEA